MRQGFTLIELMIVIAIIAIIAAIAIPNLLESRITANESAAAASLKSGFHAGQVQFQAGTYSDLDADGRGEYAADHRWMAGGTTGTTGYAATTKGHNHTARSLTLMAPTFQVADGTAIGAFGYRVDTEATAFAAGADCSENESFWVGYAAPANPGSDGRRAFAITAAGVTYATLASVVDADLELADLGGSGATTTMFDVADPTVAAAGKGAEAVPYQK